MKKGVMLLLGLIILSVVAVADVGVSTLTPAGMLWRDNSNNISYEYAVKQYKIDFDTPSSNLVSMNLVANGAVIQEIINPSSSVCTLSGNNVITCNGDFDVLTVNSNSTVVSADITFSWDIIAVDSVSGSVKQNLSFTVKNDGTAPRYTLRSPMNYTIHKPQDQIFNLTVLEAESGLGFTQEMRYDWTNTVSTTTATLPVSLTLGGDYYTATVDIGAGVVSQPYFAYFFNLTDKAGNMNVGQWHYLFIDRSAPIVTLTAPINGTVISTLTEDYGFDQGDQSFGIDASFTPRVSCDLYIDNALKSSITRSENSTESLSTSLDGLLDGEHEWYVTCEDSAGWQTISTTLTFILDTTGPSITLNSPELNSVIASGTIIDLSIDDLYSDVDPDSVFYEFESGDETFELVDPYDLDTTDWSESEGTFIVYASDILGNPSEETFTFIIDNTPPDITLLTPLDGEYSNGEFQFSANDANSDEFSCSLRLDNIVQQTVLVQSDEEASVTVADVVDGDYQWDVNCTDGVGNQAVSSETRAVKFDRTSPVVSLLTPDNTNTNGVSDFNYQITEPNFANCTLFGTASNFSAVSTGLSSRDGVYSWKLVCGDLAGNKIMTPSKQFYYDLKKPVITSVVSSAITSSTATLSWNVDETSNNSVFYGINSSLLLQQLYFVTLSTTPSENVEGFSSSTLYYYVVQSCDQWNNCENSTEYNFTTSAAPSSSSGGGGGGGSAKGCDVGYQRVNGVCVLIVPEPAL